MAQSTQSPPFTHEPHNEQVATGCAGDELLCFENLLLLCASLKLSSSPLSPISVHLHSSCDNASATCATHQNISSIHITNERGSEGEARAHHIATLKKAKRCHFCASQLLESFVRIDAQKHQTKSTFNMRNVHLYSNARRPPIQLTRRLPFSNILFSIRHFAWCFESIKSVILLYRIGPAASLRRNQWQLVIGNLYLSLGLLTAHRFLCAKA